MVIRSTNPWETEDISQLVSIGSHKLFVSTSGPARKPGEPVIVLFTGGGAPAVTYCHLQRLLSESWRVYFYDRSGYDRSERGCHEVLTAQQAALELRAVLAEIAVEPPYVLIGNSYGGIIARAFQEIQPPDTVTGMILAETATELTYQLYPQIPSSSLQAVAAGLDLTELTNGRQEAKFTDEEWDAIIEANARTAEAASAEDNRGSALALAQHLQFQHHVMSPWPVVVIRCDMANDFRIIYAAGVKRGQGTEQQRIDAMAFINQFELYDDELKAAQLRLSSCRRYVNFPQRGHDDLVRRPEVYVEEVRWVMERQKRVLPLLTSGFFSL